MEPIIIKTNTWTKVILAIATVISFLLFLVCALLVVLEPAFFATSLLFTLLVVIFFAHRTYYSWYTFEFYPDHLVFKRFNRRYEADYKYISGLESGYLLQTLIVQVAATQEKIKFRISPTEYIALHRQFNALIPAVSSQCELDAPYLHQYRYYHLQWLMIPISFFLTAIGGLALLVVLLGDGIGGLGAFFVPFAMFVAGLYMLYTFLFRRPRSIYFEPDQITIKRRVGTKVYPASALQKVRLLRIITPLSRGLHSYMKLELDFDGHLYQVFPRGSSIPLTAIESFLKKTYFKDI